MTNQLPILINSIWFGKIDGGSLIKQKNRQDEKSKSFLSLQMHNCHACPSLIGNLYYSRRKHQTNIYLYMKNRYISQTLNTDGKHEPKRLCEIV